MRLMPDKSAPCSELEMQDQVAEYLSQRKFESSDPKDRYYGNRISPKIYREIAIPNVGRISDIIVFISDRRIVNIECKMINYSEVIKQAQDHLIWADYSYVCFYAETYLPTYELKKLIENGIGLLLWKPEIFVEVIQSKYNRNINKAIRENVIKILRKKDHFKKGLIESGYQQKLYD